MPAKKIYVTEKMLNNRKRISWLLHHGYILQLQPKVAESRFDRR
jgi:hypothetical protein